MITKFNTNFMNLGFLKQILRLQKNNLSRVLWHDEMKKVISGSVMGRRIEWNPWVV